MRLLLLDRGKLSGAIDLAPLRALGELTTYEETKPLEAFNRVEGCEVLLTVEVPVGRALLDWAPRVRQVVVLSNRPDLVEMQAAADLGVTVTLLAQSPSLISDAAAAIKAARGGSR